MYTLKKYVNYVNLLKTLEKAKRTRNSKLVDKIHSFMVSLP